MRTRVLAFVAATFMAVSGGVLFSGDAFGATDTCTGPVVNATVNTNLTVPSGFTCFIYLSHVNGNVTVQPGGRLEVAFSVINGNISSNSAGFDPGGFSISLCGSEITGTTTILGSVSNVFLGGGCVGNGFENNVTVSNNLAGVSVQHNTIRANLYVNNNAGPTSVADNDITGNASCSGNGGFSDGGNTFKHGYGQCA